MSSPHIWCLYADTSYWKNSRARAYKSSHWCQTRTRSSETDLATQGGQTKRKSTVPHELCRNQWHALIHTTCIHYTHEEYLFNGHIQIHYTFVLRRVLTLGIEAISGPPLAPRTGSPSISPLDASAWLHSRPIIFKRKDSNIIVRQQGISRQGTLQQGILRQGILRHIENENGHISTPA